LAVEVTLNVTGVDEFKAALNRLDSSMVRQVHEQLRKWALDVKTSAGKRVPVVTGTLRRSIFARVSEWTVEVGADAVYAACVEFGTRFMRARPFLFPAVQEALPVLESVVCEAVDVARREAGL
jgi:HK97 gp10 family phage protein